MSAFHEMTRIHSTDTEEHHYYESDARTHTFDGTCGCGFDVSTWLTRDTGKRVVNHRSTREESAARTDREMTAWIRAGHGTD